MSDSSETSKNRPTTLYVDLDGTLSVTDTLWESILQIARDKPLGLLCLPFWLLKGKASFKKRISDTALIDPSALVYRQECLDLIADYRKASSKVVLASAADHRIVESVANHLQIFDDYMGTKENTNLAGENKGKEIQKHSNGQPFAYAGDSSPDIKIFETAAKSYLFGSNKSVRHLANALRDTQLTVIEEKRNTILSLIKALRPHQWAKNVLIFVPLFVSFSFLEVPKLLTALAAFASFSMVASSVYLLNDLLDLPSDRAHKRKKKRPFASGAAEIPHGLVLSVLTLGSGFLAAWFLTSPAFTGILAAYYATTTLYSTFLKKKIVIDIVTLSILYATRVLAGGIAIDVALSKWLIAFSVFNFVNLAMIKRYTELINLDESKSSAKGRRYLKSDIDLLRSAGLSAGNSSILVFALYINSSESQLIYKRPEILWLICPILLYWMTRTWFLTNRTKGRIVLEDPVVFALTDKPSLICGIATAALVLLAY